jgi:hypothetical protein
MPALSSPARSDARVARSAASWILPAVLLVGGTVAAAVRWLLNRRREGRPA